MAENNNTPPRKPNPNDRNPKPPTGNVLARNWFWIVLAVLVLFLSRYIIAHKGAYYRNLREVTETGAWEPWVLYLVKAVEVTARATSRKIEAIEQLLEAMTSEVREKLPKIYSKEFVVLLFKQPYCKIEFVVREGLAERKTAATYLRKLEEVGLLRSRKDGRELIFLNHRLMELLSSSDLAD